MIATLPTKDFSRYKPLLTPSDLNEIQIRSYQWFVKQGIRELLGEVSPIHDHSSEELALHLEEYSFGEPKLDEATARYEEATYEAPLRISVRLEDLKRGTSETQEVYFGDFPIMTDRGTFIINGVERVVVSQLIRSPGVYFTSAVVRGKQLMGAKVIPSRGAWLEFESDTDGAVFVKIDRHRKVPVTDLLRVFAGGGEELRAALEKVGEGLSAALEPTFARDNAKDLSSSYLEVYQRLRPGDPATPQTAQNFINAMFQRFDRYDLSVVGRFKMNQRLALDRKKDVRALDLEDLLEIVREIVRLNNTPGAVPDDIDHLGNRRVKPVGELLQGKLRIGLARLRRIVQDRMSTLDREQLMPAQLINFRPITATIKEFFSSSQLSQFMDQVNPLAELEHKRRLSALGPGGLTRERAGFEVRDVHSSHYGRICPIQTPEGVNIGLINYLATYARINNLGFLETPYAKAENGKITNKIVWLDALEEEQYRIVNAAVPRDEEGVLKGPTVEVRYKSSPTIVPVGDVDFVEVAPYQFVSVSTSLIPFLQHDDANRALMGSNMQRQAVVPVRASVPYVSTGQEEKAALDCGYVLRAEGAGEVIEVDANHITVKYNAKTKTYPLEKFKRSNQFTCISQTPRVRRGQKIKRDNILADGPSTDHGVLALGKNLLVAFMSWEGANFEDAIIISERVVRDDLFTSIHIEDFYCDVRDTKLGPEVTTCDIPNVSEEKLRNLDEEGVIRIGAEVEAGDILVGKISPKGEAELTSEERLLRAIFGEKVRDVRDTSLTLPHGKRGRIVGVKVFSREAGDKLDTGIIKRIQVQVAHLKKVQVGDKLAGRHGNKGVISQIRPDEDMPYLEDGTPVDIILNPLGVASRMNLGQILETHLGWAAARLGYRAVTPGLDSASEADIRAELKKAGLPEDGKTMLYDGRTGKPFHRRSTVGQIYIMKLNHLVEDKVHMRSIGPYSLITQQPLGGKAQFGGQRFGEMEVWALEGYGARHTLQEVLTVKSDDVLGRASAYESIIRGEAIKEPNLPAAFNVLVSELKSLTLNIAPVYDSEVRRGTNFSAIKIGVASPEDILEWSHGEVTKPETINYRTQRPEKDGLFSERIFGPTKDYECYCGKYRKVRYKGVICDKCGVEVTRSAVRRERLGHISLAAPVTHIWFLKNIPSVLSVTLGVPSGRLERVVYYIDYIVTEVDKKARGQLLKEVEKELKTKLQEAKKLGDKELQARLTRVASETRTFLSGLSVGSVLTELEYLKWSRRFGNVFRAGMGAGAVRTILENLNLKEEIARMEDRIAQLKNPMKETKLLRRLRYFKSMLANGNRPEWTILTTVPVLPPDLRPMVALDGGRYATSDLNDLYRRVINRNNRLKKLLEINAPEVIIRNEKRMLQEAVDALIDNSARGGTQQMSAQRRPLRSLADMLKGKQGRFRQNLLGKRVDYSGRSVIVVGPHLDIDVCGLPKKMALELFRPFVIGEILRQGLAHNPKHANRLIEESTDEVWAILEEVIKDKRVLLNRAPTLHRLSVQAFKPILIEGLAIQIPPLVCAAFNADFDGDQMAVHVPLSRKAQHEAKYIMAAGRNLLKPASGDLIATPSLDMVLGIYYLTRRDQEGRGAGKVFVSSEEAFMAYESGLVSLHAPVRLGSTETTVGRLIFNVALGGAAPFVNEHLGKKALAGLIGEVAEEHGLEVARGVLDRVKLLGFAMATRSGITWSMSDLVIPEKKKELIAAAEEEVSRIREQFTEGLLTGAERRARVIDIWYKAQKELGARVAETLDPDNSIYQIIDSGSRGSWAQPIQMMGMKGLVANPKGETIELPVKSSLKEGLNVLEYFISTHGARKGTTDTALKTAQAGYLTRRLIDVSQDIVIRENNCRTKEGVEVVRADGDAFGQSFGQQLYSRTALEDIKIGRKIVVHAGDIIDRESAKAIESSDSAVVKIRSPITCKSLYGICRKCYGLDLGTNLPVEIGEAVGIVAAQSIGEPGTQLTMRTFHTGGAAGFDITQGLPRVEELFEARPPKGKAILADVEGVVERIEERGTTKVIVVAVAGKKEVSAARRKKASTKHVEYAVSRSALVYVNAGDAVHPGDQLSEGHIDLHELFKHKGTLEVARYVLNEVQRIYVGEGASINNKHVEIIIRQMFSRVKVKDAGGAADMVLGEVVEKSKLLEVNRALRREKAAPVRAKQLFLGVTRVSLSTESFLSAASFQDTARVLVRAAIEGRVDPLRGLKENVIIGRLIPAGKAVDFDERGDVGGSEVTTEQGEAIVGEPAEGSGDTNET